MHDRGCVCVCWRDPRMPVISPGDENVALEVTVTNKGGEDAHHSQLSVMFPEYLPLSSILPKSNSVSHLEYMKQHIKLVSDKSE